MGVEGGSSGVGGVSVSLGPSIGASIGPAISIGRGGFGSVNEGPVRGSLEGFRPMNVSDINTIQPSVIEQAKEVAAQAWNVSEPLDVQEVLGQAEAVFSAAQRPLSLPSLRALAKQSDTEIASSGSTTLTIPRNDRLVEPMIMPRIEPVSALQVSPALEPVTKTSTKTENRISVVPAISPQPVLQEGVEEVLVQEKMEESVNEQEEEEEIVEKRLYLEDERASSQRRYEIKEAIKKAVIEASRLGWKKITGALVAKFMPPEHADNRSAALKDKGPDGSLEETQAALASKGQIDSEEKAQKIGDAAVAENKPIKYGKDGTPVKDEDVARVFKYHVVKPVVAHEIATTRIVKKKVQVPAGQAVVESKKETSLEDYPELAEVFERAA
ncbi:hypothetical protein HYS96_00065 [Candidatus Daviesbacteria bacterium]|nr:hypothetical protein [Candidatus Daviesbacteria bacterium]